jgi:hypothetical protein
VIKRNRPKLWRTSAAEKLAAVQDFERLGKALKAASAGILRSGGKGREGTKIQRSRDIHDSIIVELERRGVSLCAPYDGERRKVIAAAMIKSKAYRELPESLRPKSPAFIKHLQRHYERRTSERFAREHHEACIRAARSALNPTK